MDRAKGGGITPNFGPEDVYALTSHLLDISAASVARVIAPFRCKVRETHTVIHGAITNADAVVTTATSLGNLTPTVTIATSGSAAGVRDSAVHPEQANNIAEKGTEIKATSNAGSTGVARADVTFIVERIN